MPWSTAFDEPIMMPRGEPLVTLNDAADYIMKLPEDEHCTPEWQIAMTALILVAEKGGPTTLARIAIVRALTRDS